MESSIITYLQVTQDLERQAQARSRVETSDELSQMSEMELFRICQETDSVQARRYGGALLELSNRLKKKAENKDSGQASP